MVDAGVPSTARVRIRSFIEMYQRYIAEHRAGIHAEPVLSVSADGSRAVPLYLADLRTLVAEGDPDAVNDRADVLAATLDECDPELVGPLRELLARHGSVGVFRAAVLVSMGTSADELRRAVVPLDSVRIAPGAVMVDGREVERIGPVGGHAVTPGVVPAWDRPRQLHDPEGGSESVPW